MRRKIHAVVLSLIAGAVLNAPLHAEEAEEIKARCEAEAKESGIVDAEEKAEFIQECVADLSQGQQPSGGSAND